MFPYHKVNQYTFWDFWKVIMSISQNSCALLIMTETDHLGHNVCKVKWKRNKAPSYPLEFPFLFVQGTIPV